jgi:hypothetical protein
VPPPRARARRPSATFRCTFRCRQSLRSSSCLYHTCGRKVDQNHKVFDHHRTCTIPAAGRLILITLFVRSAAVDDGDSAAAEGSSNKSKKNFRTWSHPNGCRSSNHWRAPVLHRVP